MGDGRGGDCGDASVEGLGVRIVGWVSGELSWRVIVSIHTRIRAVITAVTVITRVAHALCTVAGTIGIRVLATGVVSLGIYHGLVTHSVSSITHSVSSITHSHAVTHAHAVAHAVAHAAHNRRVWRPVWELLGVHILPTITHAGLRHVGVMVTRFGISFWQAHHCVGFACCGCDRKEEREEEGQELWWLCNEGCGWWEVQVKASGVERAGATLLIEGVWCPMGYERCGKRKEEGAHR
jgi:hypothetical protein